MGVFAQSDPQNARGKDITAGELLRSGAARLDQELRDDPRMLGELHEAISDIYMSLGANVDGLSHAERSIASLEKAGRRRSQEYIKAVSLRAEALQEEERWSESIAAHEDLRRAAREALGPQTEWEAIGLTGLAWAATEQGRLTEAKALYTQALQAAARVAGEKSIVYVKTLGSSIQADLDLGLLDEAKAAASKAISLQSQLPAFTVTDQLVNRYYLAVILFRKRQYADSVAELDRLVPDMDRHIGARHDRTIKARALLAQQLAELGDFTQALAQERINIESVSSSRTGDPEMAALQELTFAKILRGADRFDEGVTHARTGLAYFDAKYPSPTALRERGRWVLGDLLLGSGDVEAGLGALSLAFQNIQTLSGSQQSAVLADAFLSLGNAYRLKGDPAVAARNFDAACRIYDRVLGADSQSALRCRLYQALVPADPEPEPAARKTCDSIETLQRRLGEVSTARHPILAEAQIIESDCLVRLGQGARATQLRDTAVRAYTETIGSSPRLPLRILH